MRSDDHAVVVGIDSYPGFTDLGGAGEDAEEFRKWLLDPAGGDIDPDNVGFLTTKKFHPPGPTSIDDAQPIGNQIRTLFRPLVRLGIEGTFKGRRLYIYMAGHGFSDKKVKNSRLTALYAANAGLDLAPNVVGTIYAEWFRLYAVFREIVLIMDCCRTVDLLHSLAEPGLPVLAPRPGQVPKVRTFYAYSTSWGQVSRERTIGQRVRGIFTTTLLDALRNAEPNHMGNVNGSVVRNYVHQNMEIVAAGTPVLPPEIEVDNHKEVVFAKRTGTPMTKVRIRLDPFAGGEEIVVFAGVGDPILRLEPTTEVVETSLPLGFYKAVVDGSDRGQMFEVEGASDVDVTL